MRLRRPNVIISCPECGTGYLLPEHLLGPGGRQRALPALPAALRRGRPTVCRRRRRGPQAGEQALAPAREPAAAAAPRSPPAAGR